MNAREKGFLLLTGHLGDPDRRPMTTAQFRKLAMAVRRMQVTDPNVQLTMEHLTALGYSPAVAEQILKLLSQEDLLAHYVYKAKQKNCVPITRVSDNYPVSLRKRLGLDSPGCLWAKGDVGLLEKPAIALVGNRRLNILNEAFAWEAGRQIALQGYVLVSGNARGADQIAQNSCLEHGGKVISVVADALENQPEHPHILYLSEDSYDLPFSACRALSRNRVIHSLPKLTIVAQCLKSIGGTWNGTAQNLKKRWSPVFCLDDGSDGVQALLHLGADPMTGSDLEDLSALKPFVKPLIDQ